MSVGELSAESLTVAAGETIVVRELGLRISAGQVLGLTGPSGSGKTSLLYALGGLIPARQGRLLLDDRATTLWREACFGLILQNLCLVPLLSATETVGLPLQARGVPRTEVGERALGALAAVGLAGHAHQLVGDLSGGQRQRVAVARALAQEPDVLLADEPVSALDPHWRGVVLELIAAQARRGSIVVIASSDAEVAAICDQVVTLG